MREDESGIRVPRRGPPRLHLGAVIAPLQRHPDLIRTRDLLLFPIRHATRKTPVPEKDSP